MTCTVSKNDLLAAADDVQSAQKRLEEGENQKLPDWGVFLAIRKRDIKELQIATRKLESLVRESPSHLVEEAQREFKGRASAIPPNLRDRADSVGEAALPRFSPTS